MKKFSSFMHGFSRNLVAFFMSVFGLIAGGNVSYSYSQQIKLTGYSVADFLILFGGIVLILYFTMKLFKLDDWFKGQIGQPDEIEKIGRSIGAIVGLIVAVWLAIFLK